jgi:chemotaxis protein histidine kinase CheA
LDDDTYIKSKNRRAHSDDEFSDSSSKNKSDSEDAETGSEKPTDENEGAETDSEKPTDENEGAETDSEKPTDENEDAETSSEKSGDENEDAETDSEKPTDENEDAETSSEKSADENEDVETGSEKPTDENEDAETSSEKSTSEDEDAETSSEKSADENEDVETGSEKPTDENEDAETSSEKSGDENEDAETGSEKSTSEDEDEGDDDGEENDEGEEMNLMAVAIKVAKGTELPFDQFKSIQKAAEESNDDWKKLHLKYIICAHASQHGGFIEPDYFGNLAELLNTDNMIIRQCIMWSFASILPCKNVLSPLLIRLLYKSLKDETLGWSISFLFRKMSEYDKYIPMITCSMWISMSKLLFDLTLSEQVRTTIIFTLNNVYKVRKWVAPIIKLRFEGSVQIDGIGTRVLVATVQALHSIALTGANLKKETVLRLRNLSNTADSSSMEVIHELLDFLDNKRVLSNASSYSGSGVKKELTATQNTSVSRSEEESVEPTMKLHSMDHLMNTVGHLGRTFNAESKPVDVIEGHNQAWYRTTWVEVSNLAALAKQGNLKDQDFDYLMTNFRDGPHWASTILSTKNDIFEMIAGAFRDAAEVKQAIPRNVLDVMIDRLSGTNNTIHRRCAQGLLFVLKNRQSFSEEQMNRIATKLKNTNDTEVKQNLIELYALYVSKGHHSKLDMDSIVDDLLNKETCETTSYLFFKAAAMEKRTFSKNIMKTLSKVAQSSKYGAEARDNCLWAIAYSIKHTEDKTSIHSAVIDTLGDLLVDPEKSVKQTAAIALCYYASDEKTVLPMDILERLAEMLNETDYGLLSNILSVYLRLSKQGEEIPETVVKRLGPVLYHEDYAIREKALWILKYTVDNQQKVKVKIIDQIDGCLNDSEFGIRNPAALIFIRYWTKQIQEKDGKLFQTLSGRMEKFMLIIFRHAFSLQVQQLSLDLLQSMVEKDFVLSETLIHLIECCLYDREETISKKSIDILRIYSKEHRLLPSTLICLEHLLTTETPIITNVILILKSIVTNGHRLSKKAIDILAQLLFKSSEPQEIITLLTHADRNQPISKSIDELLRQMYYGKILEHSTSVASLNKATKELFLSTNQGKPLSNYVLDLIIRKLNSIEQRATLMPILVNVVSNGQSLSKDHHRATLETMFFEMIDQPSIDLIEIFTHLTRQNQIISDRIIEQLEKYLREPSLNHFVIEIYQHLIERQKPLASKTIENIFHLFDRREWENLNDHSKHRLILFYKAVADNRPKETNQKYIPFLLGNGQSINTRKEICNSIRLLIKHRVELHLTTVDSLIRLIDNDDDPDLHQMALEILNCVRSTHTSINEDVSKFLDLLQCNDQTDDRTLIKNLKDGAKTNMNLPDRLLVRLSHMLYSCDLQLKQDAAMVLATIIPKGKTLPRQVIEVIYCTLFDGMINTKTLPLLLLHHNLEQPLPSSTISDLLYLTNRSPDESVRQCARNILENQMKNSATKIELFFEYLQSTSDIGGSKDLRQTLKMLRTVIIVEKQLSEEGLSLLVDHFSDEQQDEIIDVLLLASQYNIQFHQHQNLVRSIESALQKHPTPKLIQLIQILVHNAVIIQEQTLRILFDLMIRDNDNSALVAFEHASKRQALPPDILMYFIDLISNRSNEMFIAQRFSIIRQQISQGFVEDPLKTIEGIQFPSIIDVDQLKELDFTKERLGTIDTLLFITYFQEDVFKQPVKQWSRNCLCIEIIANCSNVTNDQIISFYQYLTQFEQLKHYAMFDEQRDIFLRHLIEKQRAESLSLSTVNDILIYATTLTATQLTILESNQIDWLMKMRSYYIEHQLTKCFQQCQYDKSLIDHLIQRIAEQEQLPAEFMSLCLQMIRSAEDVLNLLELFTSYAVNSTDLIEIFFQGETPADFETLQKKIRLLVVGKTLKSHWIGSNKNFSYARTLLQSLIQREWTIPKLLAILTATSKIKLSSNASESLIYLIDVLKILVDFNMDSNISSHLQSIFSETKIELWPSVAYHQAIEHHFGSSSSEKNLMTLLSELKQLNPQIDEKTLLNKYENIESSYKSDSSIMGRKKPIESWSKSMIQQWAKHVRQLDKSHQPTQFEMIAVMKRAVYLDSNFEPRPIQILAILIVLNARDQGGRLLQILTGEGKSTVVSMLAVFKALQNQQVDIITSSITLAKRDAHEQKTFYEYFNLTVAHNNDDTSYTSGPKSCYQADIVYGNSSQFQFDLLRHEFSLLNTR